MDFFYFRDCHKSLLKLEFKDGDVCNASVISFVKSDSRFEWILWSFLSLKCSRTDITTEKLSSLENECEL